ncbi:hypothetical protein [Natronobiforma cellulositropha]|uniref:hypothetical protein n=1 Tax=Natronobiforma cellulositropha TaxID=1679076 RepID=UPI0021D59B62|nr:hypothetical protein [Natronobiforma cellulositropha]
MPDDNRFAGLSEAVDDEPADEEPASAAVEYDETDAPESSTEADTDGASSEPETEPEPSDPSAFAFDETTKKTVYVRQETLDALEDARVLVDAQLRTNHDVRDLTGREFYDAVFRLAAADTDGLVEEIRTERDD